MRKSNPKMFPVPAKTPKSTNGFFKDGKAATSHVDTRDERKHGSLLKYSLGTASRTTNG